MVVREQQEICVSQPYVLRTSGHQQGALPRGFHQVGEYSTRITLAGVRLWSAKYAFSMKADQIPKIGLLLVFFLLKSLLFWDFS